MHNYKAPYTKPIPHYSIKSAILSSILFNQFNNLLTFISKILGIIKNVIAEGIMNENRLINILKFLIGLS